MTVELFGLARAIVGKPSVEIARDGKPLTAGGLIARLATMYPELVGTVIEASSGNLIAPNLLLLDGRRPSGDDIPIADDDRPCVLFLASGG